MNSSRVVSSRAADAFGELNDGVPSRINISRTPKTSHERLNTWSFYAQDAWTISGRLTLNIGVRLDGVYGYVPPQSSPAGTWTAISEQLIGGDAFTVDSEITGLPDWPMNIGPRLSFAYDLFGDGRAALKGGWGRYFTQMGNGLSSRANPNAGVSGWVGWNDLDGDRLVDLGPSGTLADSPEIDLSQFTGFEGGASTTYDPDATRPYSDDISLGLDMTLGSDVSFSATYHRRQHRDSLGVLNRARPASAYDQVQFTCNDCPSTYTAYELKPEYRTAQDSVITNVDILKSDYNGVALQLQKRLSNRWQILGGATFSSHKGTVHSLPWDGSDWNNPNRHINRLNGSILTDLPWVVNFAGSYLAPWDIQFAWNYRARAGNPLVATARATGLVQGSESIYAYERGDERTDAINRLLDFNVRKLVDLGEARIEVGVDAANIFNAQPALSLNTTFGSRYLAPTSRLTPRILRFTAKLLF